MSDNISIATSAMLCDLNISVWSARKLDRKVSEEVTSARGASRSAARVNKNLLADDPRLGAILSFAGDTRAWIAKVTMPWSDYGTRLVTTAQFFDFKAALDDRKDKFDQLVQDFVTVYPTLISAQAFKLGTMFDRGEFPLPSEIARKFSMRYTFMPLPESGDFRVDIGNEAAVALRDEYETEYNRRVKECMGDVWQRLKDVLDRISDRLGTDDGKNRVFRDTMVTNAVEVCDLLKCLNVTNDPALEQARRLTEQALLGVTPDELRKNPAVREDVRAKVDDILGRFAW